MTREAEMSIGLDSWIQQGRKITIAGGRGTFLHEAAVRGWCGTCFEEENREKHEAWNSNISKIVRQTSR